VVVCSLPPICVPSHQGLLVGWVIVIVVALNCHVGPFNPLPLNLRLVPIDRCNPDRFALFQVIGLILQRFLAVLMQAGVV
jgi:hypothetical protein